MVRTKPASILLFVVVISGAVWAQAPAKPKLERLKIAVAPLGWDTNFTWLQSRSGMLDKRPALEYLVGIDQNPAGDAGAECQLGYFEPGAAQQILSHCLRPAGISTWGYAPLSARSLKRWILPVAVFGKSRRNSIQRGYL